MNWAKLSSKLLQMSFVVFVALMVASVADAQKHENGGGGGGSSQHSAPPPPPPTNRGGTSGGGNTNMGGTHGNTNTNMGGTGSNNTNRGGSTGTTGGMGGTHNSNPYGASGKSGGSTGTSGTMGGSHNSNPYGDYGKAGGTTGAAGGNKSNPYGEYGNSSKGSSNNPYGSYGNKSPNTAGGIGGPGGTGSKGGTSAYGSYGSKGGNNATGGSSGINAGTKGGLNGGTRGALNGGTRGETNTGLGAGKGINANSGMKGGIGGNPTHGANATLGGKGGNGAIGGAGGRGGNTAMSAKGNFGTPPGGKSITRSNGDRVDFNKSGARTSMVTKGGTAARFDSHGRVSSIQAHGMTINQAGRTRTIITERADHSRLVSTGRNRGYSEARYTRGGREYERRTYYYNGRVYARAYAGYYWRGYCCYYSYVPAYWYAPGFYGWAYNPWVTPVYYGWGWGGAPWYGYYGYYFAPYPVYPSAAFWITDYLLAQSLAAAYDAGDFARSGGGELILAADNKSVALTPEIKKQISEEVAAIVAAEKESAAHPNASSGKDKTPDALDPAHRVFVVASALSEQTTDGTSCSLNQGDVLSRIEDTPDANRNVKVSVAASQKDDCAKGTQVSVSLDDLQEMHNHLREQVDDGLSALSKNQGKGGLPSGPAGNPQTNPDGQAQPDRQVGNDLQQQQQSADQAEKDVQQSASADNGA